MAKQLTVYILIFALLSAGFSRLFIYAGFEFNRNYIAAKVCENRNKPWLHCNGKCYLIKKIKQAEEKEKADERLAQKNLTQDIFLNQTLRINFYSQLLRVIRTPHQIRLLPAVHNTVFQPPQLG